MLLEGPRDSSGVLHAMKLPSPRSRFLMFELMKSRLQEEHVAPALGPGLFQAARPDMLES